MDAPFFSCPPKELKEKCQINWPLTTYKSKRFRCDMQLESKSKAQSPTEERLDYESMGHPNLLR